MPCIPMNAEEEGFYGQKRIAYANTVFDVVDWISICMHTVAVAASSNVWEMGLLQAHDNVDKAVLGEKCTS